MTKASLPTENPKRQHKYRRHSKECMLRQRGHFYMVFNVYDRKVTRRKRRSTCRPILNMKALHVIVIKLCAEYKFFKCWSKVTVKVTWSKLIVPPERSCHEENTCNFQLLLWNHWMEFDETWQEARSQRPLPSESPMSNGKKGMCSQRFSNEGQRSRSKSRDQN